MKDLLDALSKKAKLTVDAVFVLLEEHGNRLLMSHMRARGEGPYWGTWIWPGP